MGDVNGDGVVNLLDVVIVASAFHSIPGESRWDKRADVNNDGAVSLADLSLVAIHYGETAGEASLVFAGWRSSPYGFQQEATPDYWVNAARNLSARISNSVPSGIWILGEIVGHSCSLTFPSPNEYPNILFSESDENEQYLESFDTAGLRVWLQVEPADANVKTLIDLVLGRYHRHPCVVGFGIDVEWLQAESYPDGKSVTNEEALAWLTEVKLFNSSYKLFLKHWLVEKMPTACISDVVFVDDSQEFNSIYGLVGEFKDWGTHFPRSDVCFQIGYESDMKWWSKLTDPYWTISAMLINEVPNCRGIYWVDFTLSTLIPQSNIGSS
jgi:hypothetical protein